jgi:hypothetical protein
VFWLLGATDGHAKNFSAGWAIQPRAALRYHLEQHSLDAGQITQRQMKFAMASAVTAITLST